MLQVSNELLYTQSCIWRPIESAYAKYILYIILLYHLLLSFVNQDLGFCLSQHSLTCSDGHKVPLKYPVAVTKVACKKSLWLAVSHA